VAQGYHWQGDDLILEVRVQPRASRERLGAMADGRLRVFLTAPPTDGKANQALRRLLGKRFRAPPSSIEILSGETSRNKRLKIPSPRTLPPGISKP